jgi:D-3-phosphoglycerate dehydrogenase
LGIHGKIIKYKESESMRPKLLLLDEPCNNAREIMESVCKLYPPGYNADDMDMVYTQLTPCKTISTVFSPCTGVDHIQAPKVIHLDDEWKQTEGREVTSTAEHTWSLILQLAKLNKMQLCGKTLGIIGYGRIGKQVARYAQSFGMNIYAIDKRSDTHIDYYSFGENVTHDITAQTILQSDIITIHVPLNEETENMISKQEFDKMKSGTLLVNTSRQEIINKNDLIEALNCEALGGYADDFQTVCDLAEEHGLFEPLVLQTWHIAGNCIEAREATDIYIAKKIVEYVKERYQ